MNLLLLRDPSSQSHIDIYFQYWLYLTRSQVNKYLLSMFHKASVNQMFISTSPVKTFLHQLSIWFCVSRFKRVFLIFLTSHDCTVSPRVSFGPGWYIGTQVNVNQYMFVFWFLDDKGSLYHSEIRNQASLFVTGSTYFWFWSFHWICWQQRQVLKFFNSHIVRILGLSTQCFLVSLWFGIMFYV